MKGREATERKSRYPSRRALREDVCTLQSTCTQGDCIYVEPPKRLIILQVHFKKDRMFSKTSRTPQETARILKEHKDSKSLHGFFFFYVVTGAQKGFCGLVKGVASPVTGHRLSRRVYSAVTQVRIHLKKRCALCEITSV